MERIYIDASVIGGCLDDEFDTASNLLIGLVRRGKHIAVVSDITLGELEMAPISVKGILPSIPKEFIEYIALNEEAIELANSYIKEGIVSRSYFIDARHIALATIARVSLLVSWNFKHMVNIRLIHAYNSVNLKLGYPLLEIRSPWEVIE
ncbi:MAG: PIN domain protein [Planctomycetes bacterium]|nr:PIN domain protein [Planctomycetota bacterium]